MSFYNLTSEDTSSSSTIRPIQSDGEAGKSESKNTSADSKYQDDPRSFIFRSDGFKTSVDALIESQPTEDLVGNALDLICHFSPTKYNTPPWLKPLPPGKGLHSILEEMLAQVPVYETPNGPDIRNLRYVEASICSCQVPGSRPDSLQCLTSLESLATTWFSHGLTVCESFMVFIKLHAESKRDR